MWCERCGYYVGEVNPAICEHCGRYAHNKLPEVVVVGCMSFVLAIFSHYALTGRVVGGPCLMWLASGLTYPCDIYDSPEYSEAIAFTLASLVALPVLIGFHYGTTIGALVGLVTGLFSGAHLGGLAFAATGALASLRRVRGMPAAVWPVLAALAGTGYYLLLAVLFGPADPLVRRALLEFLAKAGLLAVLLAALGALLAGRIRYRSWTLIPASVLMVAAPVAAFIGGVGIASFEAERLIITFDPAKTLRGNLQDGYVAGLPRVGRRDLRPEKQLGHVFDTADYVDHIRGLALTACDGYLRRFGNSPEAADILLFKARVLNGKLDFHTLTRLGRLEVYFDRVNPESVASYQDVAKRFPMTRQAALARYNLAQAAYQAGRLLEAQQLFAQAEASLVPVTQTDSVFYEQPRPRTVAQLYTRGDARWLKDQKELCEALVTTRRMQSFIQLNMDFAGQPLQRLAMLDEREDSFESRVAAVIAAYPDSHVVDNAQLILAERIAGPAERAQAIGALIPKYPGSDVADRMLIQYARSLYLGKLTEQVQTEAQTILKKLIAEHPTSTYIPEAVLLLGKVSASLSSRPAPERAVFGASAGR